MRKLLIVLTITIIILLNMLGVLFSVSSVNAEGITQDDLIPKTTNVLLTDGIEEIYIGIKGDGLPEIENEKPKRKFRFVQFNNETRIEEIYLELGKWDRSYYQEFIYGHGTYTWYYKANETLKEMYMEYLTGKGGRCYLQDMNGKDVDIICFEIYFKKGYIDSKSVTIERGYLGYIKNIVDVSQWRSGLVMTLDKQILSYGNTDKTEVVPEGQATGDKLALTNAKMLSGIRIDYSYPRSFLKSIGSFYFGANNILPYVMLYTHFSGTTGSGNFGVDTDALYNELSSECGEWDILCWIGNGLLYLLFKVPILKDISSFFAYIYQFIEGLFGFMGVFGALGVFASIIIGMFLLRVVLKLVVK